MIFAFLAGIALMVLGTRCVLLPIAIRRPTEAERDAEAQDRMRAYLKEYLDRGQVSQLYSHRKRPAVSRNLVADVAIFLDRLSSSSGVSELDVAETVEALARRPSELRLIFRPRFVPVQAVALVDVEFGDHAELEFARSILAQLRLIGVAVDTYEFKYSANQVRARGALGLGPAMPSHLIAASKPVGLLLLLSRSVLLHRRGRDSLASLIPRFARTVWLDLTPRKNGLDLSELGAGGVLRVPLANDGLRAILHPGRDRKASAWGNVELTHDGLACWALCAALVENPTWDHLEAFRSHPDLREIGGVLRSVNDVTLLIDWLGERCAVSCERLDGGGLAIPAGFAVELIRAFRGREYHGSRGDFERRARQVVIEQLQDREHDDSWSRLMRQRLRARHQFAIAPAAGSTLVDALLDTPARADALRDVTEEVQRWQVGRLDGLGEDTGGPADGAAQIGEFKDDRKAVVHLSELVKGEQSSWKTAVVCTMALLASLTMALLVGVALR